MSSLSSRLDALETDNSLFLVRACPACKALVPNPEACAIPPPCELGVAHAPLPAPSKGDIVIQRTYGLE